MSPYQIRRSIALLDPIKDPTILDQESVIWEVTGANTPALLFNTFDEAFVAFKELTQKDKDASGAADTYDKLGLASIS